MSGVLYKKVGRRYVLLSQWEDYDRFDRMKVGTWRMSYCYSDGGRRYEYDVKPDTASFVAACMLAREAMEESIRQKAIASPTNAAGARPYTKKQLALIKAFRRDMAAAGGFFPDWWTHASQTDIAQAAIDAVKGWKE